MESVEGEERAAFTFDVHIDLRLVFCVPECVDLIFSIC